MINTTNVSLKYEELLLLDGKVSHGVQEIINKKKYEKSIGFELPLMNEIISKSLTSGQFNYRIDRMRSCSYCDKKYDYETYSRSSRRHYKGQKNMDKPLYYRGYQFNTGCLIFTNTADICMDCEKKYDIVNRIEKHILENDLKIQLVNNKDKTMYVKDDMQICWKCGYPIYKSEFEDLPAMMGGYYKGKCPHCGFEEKLFGPTHRYTSDFRMKKVDKKNEM